MLGPSVRHRRAQLASLEDRAARSSSSATSRAWLAAAAERARIAREMHDIVAHNLSVMIALADGAVFAAARAPEKATTAMDTVSDTGRQALAEMRRLLGVLREDDDGPSCVPQPGLPQIDQLVEQVRAAGLPVRSRSRGDGQIAAARARSSPSSASCRRRSPTPSSTPAPAVAASGCATPPTQSTSRSPTTAQPADRPSAAGGQRPRSACGSARPSTAGTVEAGPRLGGGWRVHARLWLGSRGHR